MKKMLAMLMCMMMAVTPVLAAEDNMQQIENWGSSNPDGWYDTSSNTHHDANLVLNEDGVAISKTIAPTGEENYFDITLKVATEHSYEKLIRTPSTDVVIVMDKSRTMQTNQIKGNDTTRLLAARNAAKAFVDEYNQEFQLNGKHRLAFVTFDSNAEVVFGLNSGLTVKEMKDRISAIETRDWDDPERFTNIEAGLQLAYNLLKSSTADHQFIVFISDGFPTTYIDDGVFGNRNNATKIVGYDVYENEAYSDAKIGDDGYFADPIRGVTCSAGVDYSDRGAERAQNVASTIKANNINVFSVGIDIGAQTVWNYVFKHKNAAFSTVDRYNWSEDEYYVIGEKVKHIPNTETPSEAEASKYTGAFVNWLTNKISGGPDYANGLYFDGSNLSGLENAFSSILDQIIEINSKDIVEAWAISDPMTQFIDFQYFLNQNDAADADGMTGSNVVGGENTVFLREDGSIDWKIFNSGYRTIEKNGKEIYIYELTYRVRLANEAGAFVGKDNTVIPTNGTTKLSYKVSQNGTLSGGKSMEFAVPAVEGYLVDVSFSKKDGETQAYIDGAAFTLTHDALACDVCKGDAKMGDSRQKFTAVSEDGRVTFSDVPSGHTYVLMEIEAPAGYEINSTPVSVIVSYDDLNDESDEIEQDGFINNPQYWPTQKAVAVKKIVEGVRATAALGSCVFELYDSDANGSISASPMQTKSPAADGTVTFDSIAYDKPGTYYYLIREKQGGSAFIDYDTEHEFLVKTVVERGSVTKTKPDDSPFSSNDAAYAQSGAFELKAVTTYQVREIVDGVAGAWRDDDAQKQPTFTNKDYPRTGFTFTKLSSFNGRLLSGAEFALAHDANCGCGYTRNDIPTLTVTSGENGEVAFSEILVGTSGHTYQLRETKAPDGFNLMNGATYTVTVSADGEAVIERNETSGGQEIENDSMELSGVFENTPEYLPVVAQIRAEKLYNTIAPGEGDPKFAFALFDQEIKKNPFDYIYDPKNPDLMDVVKETPGFIEYVNNDGRTILFSEMTFDKAGQYEYWILEVPGVDRTLYYDGAVFKVTITIDEALNPDGTYSPVVSYAYEVTDGREMNTAIPVFSNFFLPATGDDSSILFWAVLLAISGMAMTVLIIRRRRMN